MKSSKISAFLMTSALALGLTGSAYAQGHAPDIAPDPHHESMGQRTGDAALTTKVKTALATQHDLRSMDIHVQSRQGSVYLSGSVPSQAQKLLAESAASSVRGVEKVHSTLRVAPSHGPMH